MCWNDGLSFVQILRIIQLFKVLMSYFFANTFQQNDSEEKETELIQNASIRFSTLLFLPLFKIKAEFIVGVNKNLSASALRFGLSIL